MLIASIHDLSLTVAYIVVIFCPTAVAPQVDPNAEFWDPQWQIWPEDIREAFSSALVDPSSAFVPHLPSLAHPETHSIACPDELPPDELLPIRPFYPTHTSLQELCSFTGSWVTTTQSYNLGCACRNPGVLPGVYCWPPPYSNRYLYDRQGLRAYCEQRCWCAASRKGRDGAGLEGWDDGNDKVLTSRPGVKIVVRNGALMGIVEQEVELVSGLGQRMPGDAGSVCSTRQKEMGRCVAVGGRGGLGRGRSGSRTCGGRCGAATGFRCDGECKCFVRPGREPRAWKSATCLSLGQIKQIAITMVKGGKKKRDLGEWGCPCEGSTLAPECC